MPKVSFEKSTPMPASKVTSSNVPLSRVERIVVLGKGSGTNLHPAIIVIITHGDAHGRLRPPVRSHGASRFHGHFLKGPVALVAPQEIWLRVIGNIDVKKSVVVEIERGHPEAEGFVAVTNAHVVLEFLELPIALVVVIEIRQAGQTQGAATTGTPR